MKFGFQRKPAAVVIPEQDDLLCTALMTPKDYRKPPVRLFNEALCRAHYLMRSTQGKHTRVWLPQSVFPLEKFEEFHVYMEHAQDNAYAKATCQGRSLLVAPVSPHMVGVCPHTHGGRYLSLSLVYTFLAGD